MRAYPSSVRLAPMLNPKAIMGVCQVLSARAKIAVRMLAMLMKAPDAMTASAATPEDEGVPVSMKIRERVLAARKRFQRQRQYF